MNKAIFALCFSAISLFCYGITKETKVGDIDGSTVTVGNLLDVSDGQITVSKKKVSSDNRVIGETSTTYRANQQGTLTTEELGALNSVTGGLVNGLYPGFVHINPSLSVGWSKFHNFQSYDPIDADTVQPVIFSAGASIHTRAQNAITLGYGVNNTNNYSFVWSGDASRYYTPTKRLDTSYGTKYNGGFHINPRVRPGMTSPLENFWIGDTNLANHIENIVNSTAVTNGGAMAFANSSFVKNSGTSTISKDAVVGYINEYGRVSNIISFNKDINSWEFAGYAQDAGNSLMAGELNTTDWEGEFQARIYYVEEDGWYLFGQGKWNEKIATSNDVAELNKYANEMFRTKTDNVCHESTVRWFGTNTIDDVDEFFWTPLPNQYQYECWANHDDGVFLFQEGHAGDYNYLIPRDWTGKAVSFIMSPGGVGNGYGYASMVRVATSNQTFVTADNIPSTNGFVKIDDIIMVITNKTFKDQNGKTYKFSLVEE